QPLRLGLPGAEFPVHPMGGAVLCWPLVPSAATAGAHAAAAWGHHLLSVGVGRDPAVCPGRRPLFLAGDGSALCAGLAFRAPLSADQRHRDRHRAALLLPASSLAVATAGGTAGAPAGLAGADSAAFS